MLFSTDLLVIQNWFRIFRMSQGLILIISYVCVSVFAFSPLHSKSIPAIYHSGPPRRTKLMTFKRPKCQLIISTFARCVRKLLKPLILTKDIKNKLAMFNPNLCPPKITCFLPPTVPRFPLQCGTQLLMNTGILSSKRYSVHFND